MEPINNQEVFGFFHDDQFLNENENSYLFLNKFDSLSFNVHVYSNINENNFEPKMIFDILCDITNKRIRNTFYVFLTDIPLLCELAYIMYYNTFSLFILLDRGNTNFLLLNVKYKYIIAAAKINNIFSKPVYTDNIINNESFLFVYNILIKIDNNDINTIISNINNNSLNNINSKKIYIYNKNKLYLYEPSIGRPSFLLNASNHYNNDLSIHNKIIPDIYNTIFEFSIETIKFTELLKYIKIVNNSPDYYFMYFSKINKIVDKIIMMLDESTDVEYLGYIGYLELIVNTFSIYVSIFILSILINIVRDNNHKTYYLNDLYENILNNSDLSKEELHFLHWQLSRIIFVNTYISDENTARLSRKLYRKIYIQYLNIYKNKMEFIPLKDRNKKFILIVTGNIVSIEHGPTKTTFDRARSLLNYLGIDTLVVNTKEVLSFQGRIPFYNIVYGNVMQEYEKINYYIFHNVKIPFLQLKGVMPNDTGIIEMIDLVKRKKPYFILIIGSSSIPGDLLSNIVPAVCQTLGPSGLTITESQFQAIGRNISIDEVNLLKEFGFDENHVINARFTMTGFKPQTSILTKKAIGVSDEKFILLIVGARLNEEITNEFIIMLLNTVIDTNIYLVFAGSFSSYSKYCNKYPVLLYYSSYLGFQSDMLAVCDVCDLYINPLRSGGGTSSVEAMYKGVPVVTINYGDVALAVGNDFTVETYEEMSNKIIRYASDQIFYNCMSEKAKIRAKLLMDTDTNIKDLINKVISNPLFK